MQKISFVKERWPDRHRYYITRFQRLHVTGAAIKFFPTGTGVIGFPIEYWMFNFEIDNFSKILLRKIIRNKKGEPHGSPLLYGLIVCAYLYWGIMLFANSTILLIPSCGKLPALNSFNTSGNLLSISRRKCSSNAFTFLTATSRSKPWVPK